jgi:hypothetical protein
VREVLKYAKDVSKSAKSDLQGDYGLVVPGEMLIFARRNKFIKL